MKTDERLRVKRATIGTRTIDQRYDRNDGIIKNPPIAIDVRI
jgi:hypothetical protein